MSVTRSTESIGNILSVFEQVIQTSPIPGNQLKIPPSEVMPPTIYHEISCFVNIRDSTCDSFELQLLTFPHCTLRGNFEGLQPKYLLT